MHPADLIPAARRTAKFPAETSDAAAMHKATDERSFADILAQGLPSGRPPTEMAKAKVEAAPAAAEAMTARADEEPVGETGASPLGAPADESEALRAALSQPPASPLSEHARHPAQPPATWPNAVPTREATELPVRDLPSPERPLASAALAAQPAIADVTDKPRASPDTPAKSPPASLVPEGTAPAPASDAPALAAAPANGGLTAPPAPSTPAQTLISAPDGTPAMAWRLEADAPAATSARAETIATAGPPQPVARQIAAAVAQAGSGVVEIRLDPPELGRVQIRLEAAEEGLRAIILAERPETQDLLRRNAPDLTRDLNAAGYARVSLDFAAGGERAPRDMRPPAGLVAATGAPDPVPAPAAIPIRLAGGLDIRL